MTVMKNLLWSFLTRLSKRLIYRGMYAIHSGDKSGAFFVYVKEHNRGNTYALLMMPSPMESIYASSVEIRHDIKFNNVRFVKRLPQEVYDVCKANFEYYAKKAGIYANG